MAENIHKNLECPVCLQFFTKPIKQCVVGHSFCGKCIDPNNIKKCPLCRKNMSEARSIVLEQLLDTLSLPCTNKDRGCHIILPKEKLIEHIKECKHRLFKCEGKIYCKWNCSWQGYDILEHFKKSHPDHPPIQFNGTENIRYETNEYKSIRIITAHYQHFWFKHKIDVNKRNVYWAIQFIGPKINAQYYYYEFEIYNNEDDTKRFKITDYCKNDIENIESIFDSEQCVVISFKMLKNYVNKNGEYTYRYRLMKKKKPDDQKSPKVIPEKNPIENALKNLAVSDVKTNVKPTEATGVQELKKSTGAIKKKKNENRNHHPKNTDRIIWLPYSTNFY